MGVGSWAWFLLPGQGDVSPQDTDCHQLLSDCCFHVGTCRVVQDILVMLLSCPSPVHCIQSPIVDQDPRQILHCHSSVKISQSSKGSGQDFGDGFSHFGIVQPETQVGSERV